MAGAVGVGVAVAVAVGVALGDAVGVGVGVPHGVQDVALSASSGPPEPLQKYWSKAVSFFCTPAVALVLPLVTAP